MSQPVVHFEVIGKDPARLRKYFGELFGWEFDVPSPVAREVSEPDSYGFLDLVTSEDGTGIRGGVGGGPGYESHAVLYVGVPDVEAALQRAEELGGTRVMGPATSPTGLAVGHFTDPEGTLIGVAGGRMTLGADGAPRHFYSAHPRMSDDIDQRGIDLLVPVWHVLDLTPPGRGNWYAQLDYTANGSGR